MLEGDWTSVEDELPEDEIWVWAYAPGTVPTDAILTLVSEPGDEDEYNPDVTIARYNNWLIPDRVYWTACSGDKFRGVTHWAPIRPPSFE